MVSYNFVKNPCLPLKLDYRMFPQLKVIENFVYYLYLRKDLNPGHLELLPLSHAAPIDKVFLDKKVFKNQTAGKSISSHHLIIQFQSFENLIM